MKNNKKMMNGNGSVSAPAAPFGFVREPSVRKKGTPVVISSLELVAADLRKVEDRLVQLLEKRGGALKGPAEMMFRSGGKRLVGTGRKFFQ